MSALQLKIATVLCLYFTVLTDAETTGVVWKHVGEDITIECRGSHKEENLNLYRGLNKTDRLFFTEKSNKMNWGKEIEGRSQRNGAFPNVDILIKNLNLNDIGPYWCEYKNFGADGNPQITNGQGSVLLVVTATDCTNCENNEVLQEMEDSKQQCKPSDQSLIVVSVVITGAVLLFIIVALLIWIVHKSKSSSTTRKPRRAVSNDVYEDMRGTLRR